MEKMFSPSDAAAEIGRSVDRVYQLIKELNINALRIGPRMLVLSKGDVEKMRRATEGVKRGPKPKKKGKKS